MRLLTLLAVAVGLCVHGFAQDVTGTITGVIADASGAVVPNGEVTAVNTGTNARWTAVSDLQGTFTVRSLPIGVYDLVAQVRGFKKFESKNIRLQVNEIARVNVALVVGETAETVTVSGEVVNVDTTTSTLKTVVDQKRIEELPLNGRNPTQLMRLVAGVQADSTRRRHIRYHLSRHHARIRQRRARQCHQLRPGRCAEQRPLFQCAESDAESRRAGRVQRSDQQLQRRVRTQLRRFGERGHAVWHQRVPWLRHSNISGTRR